MRSPRLLYDGSYNLINRHCLAGARLTWPSPRLAGSEELEAAKAEQAGRELQWHCGRVTRLGNFEVASNTVTILWEAGASTPRTETCLRSKVLHRGAYSRVAMPRLLEAR